MVCQFQPPNQTSSVATKWYPRYGGAPPRLRNRRRFGGNSWEIKGKLNFLEEITRQLWEETTCFWFRVSTSLKKRTSMEIIMEWEIKRFQTCSHHQADLFWGDLFLGTTTPAHLHRYKCSLPDIHLNRKKNIFWNKFGRRNETMAPTQLFHAWKRETREKSWSTG